MVQYAIAPTLPKAPITAPPIPPPPMQAVMNGRPNGKSKLRRLMVHQYLKSQLAKAPLIISTNFLSDLQRIHNA